MKHLYIHKLPFNNVISLATVWKMYLKILQNVAALVTFQNRPSALRREENKVKFLEEQFRNEKLSFAHKKENSLLLSFFH